MRESTALGRGTVKFFNRRSRHLMMAAAMAGMGAGSAMAVSTYVGPGGTTGVPVTGDWNTAANWSPSGLPTSAASRFH